MLGLAAQDWSERAVCFGWLKKDWLGLVVRLGSVRLAGLIGLKRFVVFDWLVLFGCLGLIGWKRFVVFDWLFGFVGYVQYY